MKKLKHLLSIAALSAAVLSLASCEKDGVVEISKPVTSGAYVKFYNASPNSPAVVFYLNDVKYSAALSNTGVELATGTAYAGVFPSLEYVLASPGANKVDSKISPVATTNAGVVINSNQTTFEDGKHYTVFLSDVYDATNKKSGSFITTDAIPALDTTKAYVRLVQAIPNATTNFDLAAKQTNVVAPAVPVTTTILTDVAYKGATNFIAIPGGVYEFYLRAKGTATPDVATLKAFNAIKGKVYTIVARGDNAAATGTNIKTLDYYTSR